MERWVGRVIVVAGAATGIGAAIASSLVENGVIVVGLDVDEINLEKLENNLNDKTRKFYKRKVNLKNDVEISAAFSWIEERLGAIHGFVNSAGILNEYKYLSESETSVFRDVFGVHVIAMQACLKEVVKSMKKHNIEEGAIIQICSVTAKLGSPRPGFIAYGAAKRAVAAITEGLRIELAMENSNIKTTMISPGTVKSKLFEKGGVPFPDFRPYLEPKYVAEVLLFCLQLPPNVQISEVDVRPLGEDLSRP